MQQIYDQSAVSDNTDALTEEEMELEALVGKLDKTCK